MKKELLFENFEVEELGEIEDWVYDIEVEDNHNFFANDILVHNSCYVTFEDLVNKVLPGETDKTKIVNFLDKVAKEVLAPLITSSYQDLANLMNAYEQKMGMKRENIGDVAIWIAAKKYIMNVWDSEGVRYSEPKLKMTGVEAIRSNTPFKVREYIKEGFKLIVAGDETATQEFIKKCRNEFETLRFEEVGKPSGVNNLAEYSDSHTIYRKGCPIHVRASLVYNKMIKDKGLEKKYPLIAEGEKIKYCYMKTPNPFRENVLAISTVLPHELHLEQYIDYETQFQKTFISPMELIMRTIGWTTEKRVTLESFFE